MYAGVRNSVGGFQGLRRERGSVRACRECVRACQEAVGVCQRSVGVSWGGCCGWTKVGGVKGVLGGTPEEQGDLERSPGVLGAGHDIALMVASPHLLLL
ncbi:hypothetical protein H2248_003234, partial [Termitomyces sp. 'cryptogamus']